jgi:hypothetical protein
MLEGAMLKATVSRQERSKYNLIRLIWRRPPRSAMSSRGM